MNESAFYNAVNGILQSDWHKIEKLRAASDSWADAWQNLPREMKNGADPETTLMEIEEQGMRLILRESAEYPPILREIPQPPFALYVKGELPADWTRSIAVVGTRKASEDGRETAHAFAKDLAAERCVIVSGLAFGIDAAAHAGALAAGGRTLAVLAGGLDRIYPKFHEKLGGAIVEKGGALISEYPPGAPPLPFRFLERNRIVAGLSYGTVVIEAPAESGVLVTARRAVEANRSVYVVPGPVRDKNFAGSHALIREGAELVTRPADVLESLGIVSEKLPAASEEEKLVLATLSRSKKPLAIDKIIEITKLEPQAATRALSFLSVKDLVEETGMGYSTKRN